MRPIASRLLLASAAVALCARADARVDNGPELRTAIGLVELSRLPMSAGRVRVAILDNGFEGFREGGTELFPGARLVSGPVNPAAPISHGYGMAQILSAVAGPARSDVELELINANGFSNLVAAIDGVLERKIDIVLYSQIWEFGGNYDGRGFINAQVSRAVDAGVIWINAAGNQHGSVYSGRVDSPGLGQRLRLPGASNTLALDSAVDDNDVTLTLSWSDFQESENYKTHKDLDLELHGPDGALVPLENRRQVGRDPTEEEPLLSAHARESFRLRLARGRHWIRVVDRSGNFAATDHLRLAVTPQTPGSIRLLEANRRAEIFPPADHPRVLTVGDCSPQSSVGPTLDGRLKPDVVVSDSRVAFSTGHDTFGTSNAAALVAGAATLLKLRSPRLTGTDLLAWARKLRSSGHTGSCGGAPRWRTPSALEIERLAPAPTP